MARFYVLTIEPTLFGDTALVREWGRLGQRGRRRTDLFAREGPGRRSARGLARPQSTPWLCTKGSRALSATAQSPIPIERSMLGTSDKPDGCFAHYGSNPCRNASATACGRVNAARFRLALSR
ncbi:WGR domain-containing protein [Bradyrhizobium ottawaense]